METQTKPIGWIVAAAAAAAGIVVLDFLIPSGMSVPMLFALPILLTRRIPGWRSTVFLTAGVVILTWVGLIHHIEHVTPVMVGNRALTSFLLLVVAGLLLKEKLLAEQRVMDLMALRDSEERYALVVAGAEAAIWDWNVPEKQVFFSSRWKALRGLAEDEVSDHESEWSSRIHPDDKERVMAAVCAHFEGRTAVFCEEYRIRHKDGCWLWILDHGIAKRDSSGKVIRMAGSETDITERKRTEEVLRESEERFRTMAEAVPSFLFETDAAGWNIWASEGWCRFTGQTPDQVAGHGWAEALHPDDRATNIDRWMQSMKDHVPFESQQRLRRGDGTYVWVIARALPVRDSHGNVTRWVGSVTNVDDIIRVQEALRQSEERLRLALEGANLGSWDLNVETGQTQWNRRHATLQGYEASSGPVSMQKWKDRVHPDDLDRVMAAVERAKVEQGLFAEEHRILRADNEEERWLSLYGRFSYDERGTPVRFSGVSRDITERKETEIKARRAAADLAEAQRIAKLGSWRFDIATDRIVLSDQLCRMFDVEPSPLGQTYESFLGLVHPDDRPGVVQANVEARAHGTPFDMEFRVVKRDGSVKTMRELGYASRDAVGQVVGLFGTVQDITERKQVETALRESEERLLLALESANMGTWEWDAETDSLLCNHWQAALFGARPGDFPCTGAEALSRIHADDRARICTVVRKVLEEGVTVREEFRVVHADGSVRWLFGSGRPVQDEHGRGRHVVGVCLDITERRQDQERAKNLKEILETRVRERAAQLVEANERWDWVVRATNDAIWDWDLVRDTAYFSPRWKEMHGFQASDQPESREDWQSRIHPEDQAAILVGLEAYLSGEKETFSEEYRIQRKDGTYFWVFDRGIAIYNEQGRAVRMVGAETDITWRKGVEQTLRFREQQFRTLADNVPALFAYVDRDRRYQFVNKQYEHLFRRPHEEITGMSVCDLLGLESYAEVRSQLDKALTGESGSFEYELKLPDGSGHFLSVRYMPDRNDRGEVIGVFALSADITVLKSNEMLLREREAQLRELGAKLLRAQEEERRRISRDLHDDVMQRMGALALELHALASSTSSCDMELRSQIKGCGASAEQLTTDLQRMAHQLHPSVLEFGGLEMAVREQVHEFGARTGLSAEVITLNVPRDIPLDHATCLYRVLQEGLQNVQKHANATTVLVRLLRTGQGLGLCIHDDGRGMESTDGTGRRRGLGLTSMAERVGMLGGRFRIRAIPNDGTELHAWVPLEESTCET
ncbi:MAG: PAS domain-containing protein [Nitrospira sp.]|nr:PAS domain-containing protein [Nitrospira sp.]